MSKFANTQMNKVIESISASAKSYEEWLFNVKEETTKLAEILSPIIVELMEKQSVDVANFISGELLTISPEIRHEVEQNILRISGVYNQDTIIALEQTLSEGQTAGESLAKLKKRVESTFQDAKGYRAERIARTETLKASNATAELVYKANGFSTVKWFTNPGACDFCQTMAETTKSIGANFVNLGDTLVNDKGEKMMIDYRNISEPPLHPNCKCSIVPEG
jgi:hypothetical protein